MMSQPYHHDVRTTLTLDQDVVEKLKAEMRRSRRSFKETVNESLRRGLSERRQVKALKPFKVNARALGLRSGLNYDNVGELLEHLEGPHHK